jgi:hypothetical protein
LNTSWRGWKRQPTQTGKDNFFIPNLKIAWKWFMVIEQHHRIAITETGYDQLSGLKQ